MFRSYRLEALCGNEKAMRRRYGPVAAKRVRARTSDLEGADTLAEMRMLTERCHELTDDRRGMLAVDLFKGLRLVFKPAGDWRNKSDGRPRLVIGVGDSRSQGRGLPQLATQERRRKERPCL